MREYIAFIVFLTDYWMEEYGDLQSISDEDLAKYFKRWTEEWLPARFEEHCGDCIKVPAPCTRCHVEDIFETTDRLMKVMGQNKNRSLYGPPGSSSSS